MAEFNYVSELEKENKRLRNELERFAFDYNSLKVAYLYNEGKRERDEREIIEQKFYEDLLLRNFPSNILVLDTNLRYILSSDKLRHNLKIPNNINLRGEAIRQLFQLSSVSRQWIDAFEENCKKVLLDGNSITYLEKLAYSPGRTSSYRTSISLLADFEGNPAGIILIQNDVSEVSRAREQAEQALQVKHNFMANISHEIRTPMNAILGLSYLAMTNELPAKSMDYITKIHSSAEDLLVILDDILDFSAIEAGEMEIEHKRFRIDDIMENISTMFGPQAAAKNIDLTLSVDNDIPIEIVGDFLRLSQVINNLLSNAVKFTERGEIFVGCQLKEKDNDKIKIGFTVTDTGIGLSKEQQEGLFTAFSQGDSSPTRRYGGAGLGLAICKLLVEMMGGQIAVGSTPGQGTTMTFNCWMEESPTNKSLSFMPPEEMCGLPMLVACKNPAATKAIAQMLTRFSFMVSEANSQHDCMEKLVHAEKNQRPFALMVLDFDILDSTLVEILQILRSQLSQLPKIILLVPRNANDVIIGQNISNLIQGQLQKPPTRSIMFSTVVETMSGISTYLRSDFQDVLKRGEAPNFSGQHVLLVEDNVINQQIGVELLERTGLEVAVAENGIKALEALDAQASNFNLILMDLQMPEMDGYEAFTRIREQRKYQDIPIVALTAHAMHEERERCLDMGMNEHIAKPINVALMYSVLSRFLKQATTASLPIAAPKPSPEVAKESEAPKPLDKIEQIDKLQAYGFDIHAALRNFSGNVNLYIKIAGQFCKKYNDISPQLNSCLEQGNLKELEIFAHTIKGLAATLGHAELRQIAFAVEQQAKDAQVNGLLNPGNLTSNTTKFAEICTQVSDILCETTENDHPKPADTTQNTEYSYVEYAKNYDLLLRLLKDDDADAITLFTKIASSLKQRNAEDYEKLAAAVNLFDYEQATSLMTRFRP